MSGSTSRLIISLTSKLNTNADPIQLTDAEKAYLETPEGARFYMEYLNQQREGLREDLTAGGEDPMESLLYVPGRPKRPNDRLRCPTCKDTYSRSNFSAHKRSRVHVACQEILDKLDKMAYERIGVDKSQL